MQNKNNFFIRQTTLSNFGTIGQKKLQQAKVAIVGCGGLGSVASVYLAGSGIGSIKLIDFDKVSLSNLHRQVFYTLDDVNFPKATILANYIKKIAPFTTVFSEKKAIKKDNIHSILKDYTIILDATDNLSIKYLLNDYCVSNDKTLIYGSLYKYDGYVATFNFLLNGKRTANLRDAFPEIPKNTIPNCSEIGTLNTIVGIIGLQQANEVIKIISGIGKPLINQILIYNALENSQFFMKLKPKFTKDKIQSIFNNTSYYSDLCTVQDENLLIIKDELNKLITKEKITIISVIEDVKTKLPLKNVLQIPLSNLLKNPISLKENEKYVIICNKGISSYQATLFLKKLYPKTKILSLKNGIESF